jgi:hypothetical protein
MLRYAFPAGLRSKGPRSHFSCRLHEPCVALRRYLVRRYVIITCYPRDPALVRFGLCRVCVTDFHMQAYRIVPVSTTQSACDRRRLGGRYRNRADLQGWDRDTSDRDAQPVLLLSLIRPPRAV